MPLGLSRLPYLQLRAVLGLALFKPLGIFVSWVDIGGRDDIGRQAAEFPFSLVELWWGVVQKWRLGCVLAAGHFHEMLLELASVFHLSRLSPRVGSWTGCTKKPVYHHLVQNCILYR